MSKIIFNHFYTLRHDLKRTYILGEDDSDQPDREFVNSQWISKIHPIFAMIFSLLSKPIDRLKAIQEIAYFLDITHPESDKLISSFLNSDEPFCLEYKNTKNFFPKNIVISASNFKSSDINMRMYSPEEFIYNDVDLAQERFYKAPLGIVYMVNNVCATDCVYCYADKTTEHSLISFEKIVSTIKEARLMEIRSFSIVGGEFFLYKQWEELLDVLIEYQYKPALISTKIAINEKVILKYKKYNLPIQISLDSLNREKLAKILDVKNEYSSKIMETITLLDKYNIIFQISTVLTSYNDDIENLEEMFSFLSKLNNLSRWEIRVGFKSLYSKANFDDVKIQKDKIQKIEKWILNKKKESKLPILWSPNDTGKYFSSEGGSRKFIGARCSANYSHMIILPDGQVTICEQLYWNPRFLIGDISKSSISDVWNSSKALSLAFPQKTDFREESACFTCKIFDNCMSFPNRCIADILKGYGNQNWDYPDPRCNIAPKFINELT